MNQFQQWRWSKTMFWTHLRLRSIFFTSIFLSFTGFSQVDYISFFTGDQGGGVPLFGHDVPFGGDIFVNWEVFVNNNDCGGSAGVGKGSDCRVVVRGMSASADPSSLIASNPVCIVNGQYNGDAGNNDVYFVNLAGCNLPPGRYSVEVQCDCMGGDYDNATGPATAATTWDYAPPESPTYYYGGTAGNCGAEDGLEEFSVNGDGTGGWRESDDICGGCQSAQIEYFTIGDADLYRSMVVLNGLFLDMGKFQPGNPTLPGNLSNLSSLYDPDCVNIASFESSGFCGDDALILSGAEVNVTKRTDCGLADVTANRLFYRVYPSGATPGAFSNFSIPFFDNCPNGYPSSNGFPIGGSCQNLNDNLDQRWLTTSANVDLLALATAPGLYTVEFYTETDIVDCSGSASTITDITYSTSFLRLDDTTIDCGACQIGTVSVLDIACNTNGTLMDPSDDFISFNLMVANGINTGSSFSFTSSDPNISGANLSYGQVHMSFQGSLGSAGGGDITLTITDDSNSCMTSALVMDPGSCAFTNQCPENVTNVGTTPDTTICANTEITLCIDGDNLPPDGEICWYQVPNAGDIPDPASDQLIACVSIPSGVTSGGPVINEVLFDPIDSMDDLAGGTCEAIEIAGTPGMDLSCYIITDGDIVIVLPPGTVIPPDGFLVIADASVDCDDFDAADVDIDLMACGCCTSCDLVLLNTGEFVNLLDPSGDYVDGIVWGGPSPGNLPGTIENVSPAISCTGTPSTVMTNAMTPFTPVATMNGESIVRDPDVTGDWTNSKSINGTTSTIGMANNMPSSFCTNVVLDDTFCGDIFINSLITTLPGNCTSSDGLGIESNFTMSCPTPTITNAGPFCPDDAIELTANISGTFTYSWSTNGNATIVGGNTATIQVTGNVSNGDEFTVMVEDPTGCTGEETTTIEILSPAAVSTSIISGSCAGDLVMLDATAGLSAYAWSTNGSGTFDDSSIQNPTVTGAADGDTFTVSIVDANTCINSSTVNLMLDPVPAVSLTSLLECNEGNGTATYNLTDAESAVSQGATGVTVTWFEDAALTQAIANPSSYNSTAGSVFAQVSNNSTNCSSSTPVTLAFIMPATQTAEIVGGGEVCSTNPEPISISINISGGQTYDVVYTDGTTNFTVQNYASGTVIQQIINSSRTFTLVSVTPTVGCDIVDLSGSAEANFNMVQCDLNFPWDGNN